MKVDSALEVDGLEQFYKVMAVNVVRSLTLHGNCYKAQIATRMGGLAPRARRPRR